MRSLRCTAFEELMLAQESVSYPSVIVTKFRFSGSIDRTLFSEAVRELLLRHPLLRARAKQRWGKSLWTIPLPEDAGPADCPIDWRSEPESNQWTNDTYLDVRRESGMNITVNEHRDGVSILFKVHHALVDGLALSSVIHDLLVIYDAKTRGAKPILPSVDEQALVDRNRFGLDWKSLVRILPQQCVGIAGVRQFLMRRPRPIALHPVFCEPTVIKLPADVLFHSMDEQSTLAMHSAASRLSVTVNEILAASIFVACAECTTSTNQDKDQGQWLRMMVPVNMRSTPLDMQQSACNIVSSIFLDRTPKQILDRLELLRSINQEMNLIKKNRLALMFLFSLWVWKTFPIHRPKIHSRSQCSASVIFTNLGKQYVRSPLCKPHQRLSAGQMTLESISAGTPLAPHVSASFAAIQYARRMMISLRYDSRILNRQVADDLLTTVLGTVNEYVKMAAKSECESTV
jgi:hypothetical protein